MRCACVWLCVRVCTYLLYRRVSWWASEMHRRKDGCRDGTPVFRDTQAKTSPAAKLKVQSWLHPPTGRDLTSILSTDFMPIPKDVLLVAIFYCFLTNIDRVLLETRTPIRPLRSWCRLKYDVPSEFVENRIVYSCDSASSWTYWLEQYR